jgi:hypothetical protein
MIGAIWFYFRQVLARSYKIFVAADFFIALGVGGIVGLFGRRWMSGVPKIGDVATILVAYTATVLGFLIAALAIAITHPSDSLVNTLAQTSLPGRKWSNAYSDLIFVFSWSAFVHWLQTVFIVTMVFTIRSEEPLIPIDPSCGRIMLAAALTASVTYCLLRFLVSLITIVQVGEVYIASLLHSSATPLKHEDKN